MIETYRGVVYPYQIDHMKHMNVRWYTSKFDEGTWQLFSLIGITTRYIRENQKGMAAVEQHIKYCSEAVAGDLLVVKSKVLEIKNKSIRFSHIMYNTETEIELATCELVGVHIDPVERKSYPIPEKIKQQCIAFNT